MPDASLTIDGTEVLKKTSGEINLTNTNFVPNSSFMFRNKIINGNFDFWQRGTSHNTIGYGSVDRWRIYFNNTTQTISQGVFTNGQTEVPGNPKYYLSSSVVSSSGSSNQASFSQFIEDVRTFSGQTVTLSFWAKADSNLNMVSEFRQYFGTGGSPSTAVVSIGVTTYNLTTNWQKFTSTVSIPSISGKTIGTDSTHRLQLNFFLDAGSDMDSRTNSLGHQSGTFDIAQVQLEEGTVATPFEHRPIGIELSLCQRYFCITPATGVPVDSDNTSTYFATNVNWPGEMRAQPTLTYFGPSSGTIDLVEQWGGTNFTPTSTNFASAHSSIVTNKRTGVMYIITNASNNTSARTIGTIIHASAEL